MAESMLERVCSGRRTRFLRLMAVTAANANSTSRMVQRVRWVSSTCQSRRVARASDGSVTSTARSSTRYSKFNRDLWGCAPRSEAILLDAAVETSAAEPERLCGMTYVSSVSGEGLAYQKGFYFFQTHLFDGPSSVSGL